MGSPHPDRQDDEGQVGEVETPLEDEGGGIVQPAAGEPGSYGYTYEELPFGLK